MLAFESTVTGVGHGEERVAWEFSGRVMGQMSTFDILCQNDMRLEVKFPDRDDSIRTASAGRMLYAQLRPTIESILMLISRAADFASGMISHDTRLFIDDDKEMIIKGELSVGRLDRLERTLSELATLAIDNRGPAIDHTLIIDGKPFSVDEMKLAMVADALEVSYESIGCNLNPIIGSLLRERFIMSSGSMSRWLSEELRASRAFSSVDAVVLVNKDGFLKIQLDVIDSYLKFKRVINGCPCYSAVRADANTTT